MPRARAVSLDLEHNVQQLKVGISFAGLLPTACQIHVINIAEISQNFLNWHLWISLFATIIEMLVQKIYVISFRLKFVAFIEDLV